MPSEKGGWGSFQKMKFPSISLDFPRIRNPKRNRTEKRAQKAGKIPAKKWPQKIGKSKARHFPNESRRKQSIKKEGLPKRPRRIEK